jgi:hypothetical protein
MKVYLLYILNKAGGLIYQNDVSPELNKLSANDYLVLAGTLHGTHAIASNLTPNIPRGDARSADFGGGIGASSTSASSSVGLGVSNTPGGGGGGALGISGLGAGHPALTGTASNAALIATGKSQNPNTNNTGLQSLETDTFNLYIFQSLSGIKFIIITSPNTIVHNVQSSAVLLGLEDQLKNYNRGELVKQCQIAKDLFKLLYVAYSDYVMKNPFYSLDMPIKCSLFDLKVYELVK